MLKLYIELFLESSFANQSQDFNDIQKSIHDENEVIRKNKLIKKQDIDYDQEHIDFEKYTSLSNRNIRPRGLQFVGKRPKKRQ